MLPFYWYHFTLYPSRVVFAPFFKFISASFSFLARIAAIAILILKHMPLAVPDC